MRRLSRLLSKTSTNEIEPISSERDNHTSKSRLLDLPLEILLTVETYLQYENALSLSLTCKYAYGLFFKRHKPSAKHNGRESFFLRLLEREMPALVSCSIHERLYMWAKQKSNHYQCPMCTSNKRVFPGCLVVCNKGCKSSFYGIFEAERRLILRHVLLGPEFGVSSRLLSHVCKKSHSKRANEITPKVVEESLMLWRTHHYTTTVDFKDWHLMGIDAFEEAICVHSETGLRALLCAAIYHAKQSRANREWTLQFQTNKPGAWMCPIRFKCNQCATDMRLHMDQISLNNVVVRFDVYQDLGGLQELSVAQRQVLGARNDWRQQELNRSEKLHRLCEDLEQRYHSESLGEAPLPTDTSWIPKDAYFLNQWTYNIQRPPFNLENPVNFHHDPMIPQEVWRGTNTIPFIPREEGI